MLSDRSEPCADTAAAEVSLQSTTNSDDEMQEPVEDEEVRTNPDANPRFHSLESVKNQNPFDAAPVSPIDSLNDISQSEIRTKNPFDTMVALPLPIDESTRQANDPNISQSPKDGNVDIYHLGFPQSPLQELEAKIRALVCSSVEIDKLATYIDSDIWRTKPDHQDASEANSIPKPHLDDVRGDEQQDAVEDSTIPRALFEKVEEERDEYESELITTKLRLAEISQRHDELVLAYRELEKKYVDLKMQHANRDK